MADWTDLLPTALRAPVMAYQNKSQLHEWWKRLLVYAGRGDTNVVVTGVAGAGKSVLTLCQHGEVKDHEWEEPGTSTEAEKKAITVGEWTQIFTVVPGQEIAAREAALDEAFNKHKNLEGVVHVVDWGFTSVRSSVTEQKLRDAGYDTLEALRDYNLQRELEEFKKVANLIATACATGRGPKWITIAVSKADLYFDKLDDAKMYYYPEGSSPFVNELNSLIKRVGSNNIKCRVVPVCPKPKPYVWGETKVSPQLITFDEPANYMKNFISILAEVSHE
ncbi:hypothetical protein LRP52_02390 [Photobacterium sp. ZSDE20]|uniref:Uncharacterized protein n=1 Tax=Photobacterium pectinilyticum TaxID=2906793 RepID=A0ABT1N0Y2_9GAMM|nr:hypothetical protein [Photobacterium sp. ZSDE20]MCQ1056919.1 hypothetical protein [Photobacterium sp. ZSDE20]MDD1821054.1 hypothetical protein [Photobacterium sp. ZSDE20]